MAMSPYSMDVFNHLLLTPPSTKALFSRNKFTPNWRRTSLCVNLWPNRYENDIENVTLRIDELFTRVRCVYAANWSVSLSWG